MAPRCWPRRATSRKRRSSRALREPITNALSRRLGRTVSLAVKVDTVGSPTPPMQPIIEGSVAEPVGAGLSGVIGPVVNPAEDLETTESDGEEVDEEGEALAAVHEIWPTFNGKQPAPNRPAVHRAGPAQTSKTRLNEKYTFDTFVIGASNRFAHAAAVAVAEAPARAYNPLFIWGESGLGKTHLLHAVGHYAQTALPGHASAVCVDERVHQRLHQLAARRPEGGVSSAATGTSTSCWSTTSSSWRARKEPGGVLPYLQHAAQREQQIVVSSDRPPKRLETLEDRLRTRFEWGLITDIQPPELEPGSRSCARKRSGPAERAAEVLEFIAARIEHNIRELEGALIRVTAFASLNRQPVDLGLAEIVLRDLIPDSQVPEISASTIMAVTAEFFGVTIEDLCGPGKTKALASRGRSPCICARADGPLAAQDRADVRRPRPHDRDARGEEDPQGDGRAPRTYDQVRNSPPG